MCSDLQVFSQCIVSVVNYSAMADALFPPSMTCSAHLLCIATNVCMYVCMHMAVKWQ